MADPSVTRLAGRSSRPPAPPGGVTGRESSAAGRPLPSSLSPSPSPSSSRSPHPRLQAVPGHVDAPRSPSPGYGRLDSSVPLLRRPGTRRRLRNRSAGGFLLQDRASVTKDAPHHRAVRPRSQTPEPPRSRGERPDVPGFSPDTAPRRYTASPQRSPTRASDRSRDTNDDAQGPARQSPPAHHVDAAQIIHMALNLSESRRIAARRSVSRGEPPRLVPLPDGSSSGNLRQHLQQQRTSLRNLSPKPNQAPSPRVTSGAMLSSPLQPAFDSASDGQYRYHFSPSTLARTQRAKEHLELMAQYRRLLDALPPLKPCLASPPNSASANRAISRESPTPALGRQYNPLQYIRNRKIRARERKVIDGEKQGFGDVESVHLWVDKVCSRPSPVDSAGEASASEMPPFLYTDDPEGQVPSDAAARAAARVRRPRVDWFIEPCDIIADAYWLEQEDHKHLIEDRQWRRIFPPPPEASRPMPREAEGPSSRVSPQSLQDGRSQDPRASRIIEIDADAAQGSARDRAKQKLQHIRTFPHRHSGLVQGHHHLSASDLSDTENEVKEGGQRKMRLGRSGTISCDANDLLQRQMLEMVAKEARERELAESAVETEHVGSPKSLAAEQNPPSQPPSGVHSRKESLVDTSDSDLRNAVSRARFGRRDDPRQSVGRVSSMATSPELRPSIEGVESGLFDTQISPSRSRAASPSRNPLAKIKQIMREKNGEPGPVVLRGDLDQDGGHRSFVPSYTSVPDGFGLSRHKSSPTKGSTFERTSDPRRLQRGSTSVRQRPEDQGASLRGMFKGPRIDTVIRGGVSKLGDILRRKDAASSESQPESTDESGSERTRGGQRSSLSLSRTQSHQAMDEGQPSAVKHYLDSMPEFSHTIGHSRGAGDDNKTATPSSSANHSRRSSRFDLLKSRRIDSRSAASSVSPPTARAIRLGDSDVSEPESWQVNAAEGAQVADGRLGATAHSAYGGDGQRQGRHWSIADKERSTKQSPLSRREIARMRALILSSGIKAMEISRRANEPVESLGKDGLAAADGTLLRANCGIDWADMAQLSADGAPGRFTYCELHPMAAKCLGGAIQASGRRWRAAADRFTTQTSPGLQRRIGEARARLVDDLSEMARAAADEADATSRDLALGQPLKVKHVVDVIDKMMRRRRRRLRWVRRALWLMVEWLLVGFMWYVWFVVMILRVFLGIAKGAWRGVRWLLWL